MVKIHAQDLLKTEGILTSPPDTTLSKITPQIQSSHDAVFVIENNAYQGVINPYHAFFRRRYPAETKAKNALFHGPKLTLQSRLSEIARQMIESKIYFLPVVGEKEELMGIVTIRRILQRLIDDEALRNQLPPVQFVQDLVTILERESIETARNLMIENKVSRLPVVNNSNQLVGIISRRDISQSLAIPIDSQNSGDMGGEKEGFYESSISPFMTRDPVTAPETSTLVHILQLLVENNVGSVVITNSSMQPLSLITNKSILSAVTLIDAP